MEILQDYDVVDKNTLLALETSFIDYFQTLTTQGGYNVCLFGYNSTGIKRSEEFKKRDSESKLGKKHTQETKNKMSIANRGRIVSEEAKEKIRLGRLGKKRPEFSAEWKANMSKAHIGLKQSPETIQKARLVHMKPIKQIDKDTEEIIRSWDCIGDASRQLGCRTGISLACRNPKTTYHGFKWQFA